MSQAIAFCLFIESNFPDPTNPSQHSLLASRHLFPSLSFAFRAGPFFCCSVGEVARRVHLGSVGREVGVGEKKKGFQGRNAAMAKGSESECSLEE